MCCGGTTTTTKKVILLKKTTTLKSNLCVQLKREATSQKLWELPNWSRSRTEQLRGCNNWCIVGMVQCEEWAVVWARRFMTWGQTELHQYGRHNAVCSYKEQLCSGGTRGQKQGELSQVVLPWHSRWREWKQMEVWDLHSGCFCFRLCSASGCVICIEKWFLLLSLSCMTHQGLWARISCKGVIQRYAWIDSCAAPITHSWHRGKQVGRQRSCTPPPPLFCRHSFFFRAGNPNDEGSVCRKQCVDKQGFILFSTWAGIIFVSF